MENFSGYDAINYFLRFFGRIGFCLLIFALYRVYRLFASPLTQKRHKKFIVSFGISIIVSFALLILNYVIPMSWLSTASISFNVFTTYIFAFYLYLQGNVLETYRGSEEFKTLSRAMDALILKLKTT